jgi:hypothetical protein
MALDVNEGLVTVRGKPTDKGQADQVTIHGPRYRMREPLKDWCAQKVQEPKILTPSELVFARLLESVVAIQGPCGALVADEIHQCGEQHEQPLWSSRMKRAASEAPARGWSDHRPPFDAPSPSKRPPQGC